MMSSPNDTNTNQGNNASTNKNNNNNNDPKDNNNNTMATSTNKDPPKKKKPIQHLLAGGTAGFVESSICHPLDTIKTRMQLRRQTTLRSRALGSMRDAGGEGKKGALHRTAASDSKASETALGSMRDATTAVDSKTGALHRTAKAAGDTTAKGSSAAMKNETVTVKPDVSKAKSATAAKPQNALHDVGYKQRLPPASSSSSIASSVVKNAASTSTKSAAASSNAVVAPLGPFGTAKRIVQREGPLALYKGLTAVYTGIVPKMAIRFVSFEYYRDVIGGWYGMYAGGIGDGTSQQTITAQTIAAPPPSVTFLAGLLSGLTEAILIVTPAEVCKIRMQSQYHSLMDPSQIAHAKYRNVVQTAALVVKEEGFGALYKGIVPTMLRQGCNQAVNFTVYNWSKKQILGWKRKREEEKMGGSGVVGDVQLDHWQSLLLGGLSGGMGPLVNNPLDVVKTRMQKQVIHPGKEPKYKSLVQSCVVIAKEEGTPALWKGITPRLMRIMPGQAITFMTYEAVSAQMEKYGMFD